MTLRSRQAGSALVAIACTLAAPGHAQPAPDVVDLHVDLPYQLHVHGRRLDDADGATHPDRLARGSVRAIVAPLFVTDGWALTSAQVRARYEQTYQTLLSALGGTAGIATSRQRVRVVLAFEGADGFADAPHALVPWIGRGACLVGLVHTRTNALAGSSSDPKTEARRVGLTALGERVVRTAYAHGALVDIAHASDAAVRDILPLAMERQAPLVCSHTGVRALKNIERNVSDQHLRWIAASGGVVGIDLHSGHIGRRPGHLATLKDVVLHLEHAVAVAGIDHVAIGSDLDGGIAPPMDSEGAATWPLLASRLRSRGWSEQNIAAVFHGNAERVLRWAADRGCGKRPGG